MHDQASLFANPMDSDDIDTGRNPATNVTGGKRQSEDPVTEDKQNKRQNISSTETIPNNGSSSSLASSITTSHDQRFQLSFTQKEALEIIMGRKSVFFTGAAGTGKSYILKIFRQAIQTLNMAWRVGITAPTGIAACNIGGVTLHSWAGIFNEKAPLMEVMIPAILKNKQALSRWRETEILVIDEVSMLSNILFERLNIIAQTIRRNCLPFGGIQLVFCGDFLQLPPVGLGQPFDRSASTLTQLDQIVGFCFESPTWKQIFGDYDPLAIDFLPQSHPDLPGRVILLQKVFRQKDDQQFLENLHSLRLGQPSEAACRVLRQKVQETLQRREQEEMEREQILATPGSQQNLDKIEATKLFCVNHDVDHFNQLELDKIAGDVDRTHSHPGEDDDNQRPQRYKSVEWGVPQYVAQLAKDTKAPKSLVLKVGAQVMLLKNLSTATGLVNGARGVVVAFETCDDPHFSRVPVVKFRTIVDGKDGEQTIRIGHAKWEVVLRGKLLATKIQIPLMLAWAMSVHKAQGMTIPWLEVSFNKLFEFGQAYVALSRAPSLRGLWLTSFTPADIRAHPKVLEFYAALEEQERERVREGQEGLSWEVLLRDLVALFRQGTQQRQQWLLEQRHQHHRDPPRPEHHQHHRQQYEQQPRSNGFQSTVPVAVPGCPEPVQLHITVSSLPAPEPAPAHNSVPHRVLPPYYRQRSLTRPTTSSPPDNMEAHSYPRDGRSITPPRKEENLSPPSPNDSTNSPFMASQSLFMLGQVERPMPPSSPPAAPSTPPQALSLENSRPPLQRPPLELSEELRRRIEENHRAALLRRQQHLQQQQQTLLTGAPLSPPLTDSTHACLTQPLPLPASPDPSPSPSSSSDHSPGLLDEETRQRIEQNRLQALRKLAAKKRPPLSPDQPPQPSTSPPARPPDCRPLQLFAWSQDSDHAEHLPPPVPATTATTGTTGTTYAPQPLQQSPISADQLRRMEENRRAAMRRLEECLSKR